MDSSDLASLITRYYLAFFFSAVALFYTMRVLRLKRRTSRDIIFPGDRFCRTWWNHFFFRVFRVIIWLICVSRAVYFSVDEHLIVFEFLYQPILLISGCIMLTIGFVITVRIHCNYGDQWRSGIDPNGPDKIITHGWYGISRNPMFLSIGLAQTGFFFALPSAFSLICLCFGLWTLFRQAHAEEKHLKRIFPNEYYIYATHVPRWL